MTHLPPGTRVLSVQTEGGRTMADVRYPNGKRERVELEPEGDTYGIPPSLWEPPPEDLPPEQEPALNVPSLFSRIRKAAGVV